MHNTVAHSTYKLHTGTCVLAVVILHTALLQASVVLHIMLLAWTPDRQSVVYTLSIDHVVLGGSVEMAQEHEEMGRLKMQDLKMGDLTP